MKSNKSTTDQILDLLLEALQERQKERGEPQFKTGPSAAPPPAMSTVEAEPEQEVEETTFSSPPAAEPPLASFTSLERPQSRRAARPQPKPASPPPRRESIDMGRMLWRLALAIFLLVILSNIPFNQHGTSLARAMPDTAAFIVRDGLLLKGSGPEVYVLENNQRRWITTLDAFTTYGYRWENVHEVEDAYLEAFQEGRPIHLLIKCEGPHVFALEDGTKRWIKDIPTFEAQGYVWEDIRHRSCSSLRNIPDGVPIPPDAGEPPVP